MDSSLTTPFASNSSAVSERVRQRQQGSGMLGFIAALLWPLPAALRDLIRFDRDRSLAAFTVFCVFAGWVFNPSNGSDGQEYAQRIDLVQMGLPSGISEPVPAALVQMIGLSGLPHSVYFMIVGLIYAIIFRLVCLRLFDERNAVMGEGFAYRFFTLLFLLNFPVFAAINARYQLGLWQMMLTTLLILDRRWWPALAACVLGCMIHFGFVIFAVALAMMLASRMLRTMQAPAVFAFVAISFVVPADFLIVLGKYLGNADAGGLAGKVAMTAGYAQTALDNSGATGPSEASWFLQWFTSVAFWSLLLSGSLLWWQIRKETASSHFQLWMLVLCMWGLRNALGGDPETGTRIARNTITLMLLFHARWFIMGGRGAKRALAVTVAPMTFYMVVYYRIWLGEASLASVLPLPFGLLSESLPRVYEFLTGNF